MLKKFIRFIFNFYGYYVRRGPVIKKYKKIYRKYQSYTMLSEISYFDNLFLTEQYIKNIQGDVIECGVWRGGMIAGIAEFWGKQRNYYLFDSFEGLPDAQEIDGEAAKQYQRDTTSDSYYNNCAAEIDFAETAMQKTNTNYIITKGWFKDSLKDFKPPKIALLRLDGDWYDSTMECLVYLYPFVVKGGLIIIDDYFTWDGCSRAVHDYLSSIKSTSRINRSERGVCFIIKNDE